jgi:hypothetical protein
MRKQFETRVRLVIYMDARDLHALTARAKREGRVLVAWAREALLREIDGALPTFPDPRPLTNGEKKAMRKVREGGTVHTAASNRLTCMCATCSAYRNNHGIPLGGFKKSSKEKR